MTAATPVMKQFEAVKAQYPDALVLFRMGDFYETFNEDAKIASRILNITLTKRANGKASTVPLAGFPYHALESYLHKLLKSGLKVAICEQVEDPKKAKGIVKREVVEVVTPGTTVSDRFLNSRENNFLVSIHRDGNTYGVSTIDFSTGEFYLSEYSDEVSVVERIKSLSPSEIIFPEKSGNTKSLFPFFRGRFTEQPDWSYQREFSERILKDHFQVSSLKGFGVHTLPVAVISGGALLHYLNENYPDSLSHITKISPFNDSRYLLIDGYTRRNLEIFDSMSGIREATLIHVLDKTATSPGGRLLRRWLTYPVTDIDEINFRQNGVETLLKNETLSIKIHELLKLTSDGERILSRLSANRATPKDLIGLKQTISTVPVLRQLLAENTPFSGLFSRLPDVTETEKLIIKTLKDDPPASTKEGGYIREGVNSELDELREISHNSKNWIARLQTQERERLGIPSLKVGYNKVFGYYIEVTRPHLDKVPTDYIRKQTLVNSERFITEDLKTYEDKILTAEERIIELELEIFQHLRKKILEKAGIIQENLHLLAFIDVLNTFARIALGKDWVRPILDNSERIIIKAGRHPVVESLLPPGEKFIPNDLEIDNNKRQIQIITGPNMAGKSTYLRQIGLIVILAQMGCYVPAESAMIGIVDKLFTRVGASDNVAMGESTFLSEMNETANILNNVTPRSLVLLDEIGRGTSTYDGLAIAWAVTEFLHNTPEIAPKTLFATHYHELTELEKLLPRVFNTNVAVKEHGDKVIFLRKIVPGACDKSYGIHVARMAGIPESVVRRANEILSNLSPTDTRLPTDSPRFVSHTPGSSLQLDLFSQTNLIEREISELDINNLTPLEALNTLHNIKKKLGHDNNRR